MKKEIVAIGVCAILLLVVFSSGCIKFGEIKKEEDESFQPGYLTPTAALTMLSSDDNNYIIQVAAMSRVTNISDVKWYILDGNDVLQAGGYILIANANSTMDNSICIYTYDYDQNMRLSANDRLKVWDSENKIQPSWKFRLKYVPTDGIMAEITFV